METFSLGSLDKYKQLCALTTKAVEKSHATERGELLDKFWHTLNVNRVGTKFKVLSKGRVAQMISHIPTKDLYYFHSICNDAGNRSQVYAQGFSKRFYYELKTKDNVTTSNTTNS